jgi:hypothetical protein
MLKAYLDRGARPDSEGVMCIAAAVFKPNRYKPFVRRWNALLEDLGVPYLHATDFYNRAGIYALVPRTKMDAARLAIPRLIDTHVYRIVSVSFRQEEFERIAPKLWRERFGSLNVVAVQVCLDAVGHLMNTLNQHGRIVYVLETGEEYADGPMTVMKPERRAFTRYHSHTYAVKGAARGLEVADCFAWHWNKFYGETLDKPIRAVRKDLLAMIERNPEKYKVYLFTGERLDRFLIEQGCTRSFKPA